MFKRADVFFLISAAIAFLFANYLWFAVDLVTGFFVALWVPSNLLLAFYFRVIASDGTSAN